MSYYIIFLVTNFYTKLYIYLIGVVDYTTNILIN